MKLSNTVLLFAGGVLASSSVFGAAPGVVSFKDAAKIKSWALKIRDISDLECSAEASDQYRL